MSEPLNAVHIRAKLPQDLQAQVKTLEVLQTIDSTNTALAMRPAPPSGCSEVLLAEFQTAGRGRRGRSWLTSPGGALCLSLSWAFPQVPREVGALSLAIGVCVLRALQAYGVTGAQLKWPNDILVGARKLGGILIELRTEPAGPACVVVGIGLNVSLSAELLEAISAMGLPATDLISEGLVNPSRNAIAASVIDACLRGLMQFEREGLRPFVEEWQAADALVGRAITTEEGTRGFARGIDATGALLVETLQGMRKFLSGDVTVRAIT